MRFTGIDEQRRIQRIPILPRVHQKHIIVEAPLNELWKNGISGSKEYQRPKYISVDS